MNFKYPISKEDGTDYNAEELYAILSKEKSGHYLLGNHQFWHGGIHFSTETVKQCVLKQPIRCIADGEVIAYRINQKYQSSKLNNTILKYSNSFCLVKHEYESPTEPIKIPEKDPTKLNEEWQNKKIETLATSFISHSDEAYSKDKKVMPKGLKLEILHVNDTTKKISNTEYYLAKAKVLEAIEANAADKTSAYSKDEELWFAAFKKDGSLQSSVSQKTDLFKQTNSTDATTEGKKESEETTKSAEAKTNKLTFYSLYMHLLPYDEYPVQEEEIKQQAKIIASNLRARDKIIGDENAQVIGKISKDTIVNILSVSEDKSGNNYCAKVTIFNNSGKITSINETTKKEEQVTPPADGFWIVLKDKQTNNSENGEIAWHEYAQELPISKREYPKYWAKQVTAKVIANELNVSQAPGADSDIAGEPLEVSLKKDDEVIYDNSKVKSLKINDKAYQMAECKLVKDKVEFTEKGITTFWACIESNLMTVIKAEPDTFDTVDTTNIKISAGEPIGYLGLYEVPNSPTGGKSDNPKKQVHIEVFTVVSEEELKKFLDNEAGLTIGQQYIKIPKGTVLDKQQTGANKTSDVTLNSTWQNKETKTLANNFASYASEGLGATGKKRMPKGLKLKILQVKDTTNKIGKSNYYYVAKAKVLEDIKADIAGTNDYKKDEEIWFAAFTADKKITYINNQKTNLLEDVTPEQDNTVFSPDIQKLQNTYYTTQYDHIVSPDMAKLVNDKYTVTIYENKQSVTGCVAQDKIQKISQYNLTELGFKIIKEENANAAGNVTTSKDGFIDQEKMTPFFQDLCKEIDSKENGGDGDGKLSLPELRSALKDPGLSEKWSKLIAYHPTEWQAKGDDAKWNRLVTDILSGEANRALLNHEKERITNLVFWDDVPDLKGKTEAFHFHPVAFLEHLQSNINKDAQIIFPLKVKPKNDKDGVWKNYYWAAKLSDSNASQAIFGTNRDGGARKHAAIDLYTQPFTEVVAICDGVVLDKRAFYCATDQVTVLHETKDGRKFIVRYGELDHDSIVVKIKDSLKQGDVIGKTGKLMDIDQTTKKPIGPLMKIGGEVVFMLHFEYYTGKEGYNLINPLSNSIKPYQRRSDLTNPIEILEEGYRNTFEKELLQNQGDRKEISLLTLSEKGKTFIKEWEGLRLKAYNDSKGYCTIGYGHLIASAKCEDITLPEEFKNGITKAKAEELFETRITSYVSGLKKSVTVKLYQYEFDALVSLLFNIGASGLDLKAPKLKKKLNSGDYNGAATEFLDITNGGDKGLIKRRKSENKLFLTNNYDSSH